MNIYEYDDFREYLSDRYQQWCTDDSSYSQRKFAASAGFTNPGFLNDVIKGRRGLSKGAEEKIISVLGLSDVEAEFFRLLVEYRQEKNEEQRNEVYRKLVLKRNRSKFARLNPVLNRYYQDYRYPLLRAALMTICFKGDFEALGRFVVPPVPAAQVKKYIRDLCDWGMVTQQEDGVYRVTDRVIEPPKKMHDQIKQINREWIMHTLDPLIKLSADKRHVSSMLLSVSEHARKVINDKIEQFRQEIWSVINSDNDTPDRIMLLNIQYVPKSGRAERI